MPTQDPLPDWLQEHRWTVGRRLHALRIDRGLSQVQLAERAGMDHRTISRLENGRRNTGIDEIARLARALGVEPWQLLGDAES